MATKHADMYKEAIQFEAFLEFFGNPPKVENTESIQVSPNLLREIADRLSNFWLDNSSRVDNKKTAYKVVEGLFPERVVHLKLKLERLEESEKQVKELKTNQQNRESDEKHEQYNNFIKRNPSVEELLLEAEKQPNNKLSLYIAAAQKLAENGNISQVVSLLRNGYSQKEISENFTNLFANLVSREISKRNYTQAISLIELIPVDSERARYFAELAKSINHYKPENQQQLVRSITEKIRKLAKDSPQTVGEMKTLLKVVEVFSYFEPDTAFQLISNLIPTLNKYAKAQTVVESFLEKENIRNGEYLLTQSFQIQGLNDLIESLKILKVKDLNKTIEFINKFERPENRVYLKLQITEN